MPKLIPPLTDLQIRKAKYSADGKGNRMFDGGGLYIEIFPNGIKTWRLKYRRPNTRKENRLTFGTYPATTLVKARAARKEAVELLKEGIDPSDHRKEKQRLRIYKANQTFEKLARDWHASMLNKWQPSTAADNLRRLENDIFPEIGMLEVGSIEPYHVIAALKKVEKRHAHELASRLKGMCARIFSYANQHGIKNSNPAQDLKDVLITPEVKLLGRIEN